MRWGALVFTGTLVAACGGGDDGGSSADAAPSGADANSVPAGCVSAAVRGQKTLTVSGSVVDFVTGDPVSGATVNVSTGWDVAGGFPDECPPIATFTTDADGRFGAQTIEMGSPVDPPIILFMVSGVGLTPTSSDQTVNSCEAGDCGNLGHTIAVPTQTLGDAWRSELDSGGMADADSRGLTIFEFREFDFTPAAGVVPSRLDGVNLVDLTPATEVRFLDVDRTALTASDSTVTTATGVAVIGLDTSTGIARIAGARLDETWADLGVLLPPGWLFLEDRRVSPP